jgi:hypothetical protein
MKIEDVVGVKFGIENEVDMEEKGRGWDLEDIAGDSLRTQSLQRWEQMTVRQRETRTRPRRHDER